VLLEFKLGGTFSMGRRDFQSTVADTLPRIIQENAKTGVGSIRFFKKDKKTAGKLYLRGGAIYAIELSTYTPNIVNRIATNEYISENAREQVLDKFKDNPADLSVINYVLTGQLFPEKPLLGYIKDYFLDAFDELYTWDAVNVEWRMNDEPSPLIPTVPNVSPEDLIEKTLLRRKFLEDSVAQEWNSAPKDMGELGFRRNYNLEDQDYSVSLILSIADGKWSISAAAKYLGMSRFNLKKLVFELWVDGVVDILHPSGLIITNRTPADIKNSSQKPSASMISKSPEAPNTEFAPTNVENSPIPESSPIEITVDATPEKESLPVQNQPPQFIPNSSLPAPAPVFTAPAPFVSSNPPVAPAPVGGGAAYTPNVDGNRSTRISQLAQQLRQELSDLDSAIATETTQRQSMDAAFSALQTERNAFVEQINSVDGRILLARQEMAEKEAEIKRLHEERDGITSLLK